FPHWAHEDWHKPGEYSMGDQEKHLSNREIRRSGRKSTRRSGDREFRRMSGLHALLIRISWASRLRGS
ncbi:MAG: hypothetical protein ACREA0_18765, partial [bacterium]